MTLSSFSFVPLMVIGPMEFAIYFMRLLLTFSSVMAATEVWYFYPFRKRMGYPGRKED